MKLAAGISLIAVMYLLFGEQALNASGLNSQNYNIVLPVLALFILLGTRVLFTRRQ